MSIADLKVKYPDRVPIYVQKKENSDVPDVPKHKYLVPKSMTMGNFIYVIRKNIKLKSDKAMFVFVDNKLVCNTETMESIYNQHHNEDGFLYTIYSSESTFG